MQWKWFGTVAVLVALSLAVWAAWPGQHQPATLEKLTVVDARQILSSLLYIALEEHYIADEGLEVTLRPVSSGKAALAAVIEGQADIATVAEVPFLRAVWDGQPVQVFATIQTTDKDIAVLARTDAGITMPHDLAGKRIGTIPGTSGSYFLELFLTLHGLKDSGVVVVPYEPAEAVTAFVAGDVAALSAWTALRLQAQARLSERTVTFFSDGLYTEAWTVAARATFLQQRPETAQKLLRALLQAERFTVTNRSEAMDIIARWLDLDRTQVAELWDNFGFTVSLDQALIVNLESQARALRHTMPATSPPNFLRALYLAGLTAVAPHRVLLQY